MKNPDTESCRVMVKGPRCQALVAWRSFVLDNPFHRTNFSWAFLLIDKNPTEVGTLNACLLATVRNLLSFRQHEQTQHSNHSKQGPGRENHKSISPAHEPLYARNQLDRNGGQQKSQTRLTRQVGSA